MHVYMYKRTYKGMLFRTGFPWQGAYCGLSPFFIPLSPAPGVFPSMFQFFIEYGTLPKQ